MSMQVGSEFATVESLWSHFESVMGKRPEGGAGDDVSTAIQDETTIRESDDR